MGCTGCPPMYEGKLCATTTWYEDSTIGACGCGKSEPVPNNWWTLTSFTAALNNVNLDVERPGLGWCPSGCGQCYELCTTGGIVNTKDVASPTGKCHVFKITTAVPTVGMRVTQIGAASTSRGSNARRIPGAAARRGAPTSTVIRRTLI